MATKTKTAKSKAKAKTKPKAKASPEANPSPETTDQAPALPVLPEGITEQAFVLPRTKRPDFSVRDAAGMLRILADETRITIVMLLAKLPRAIVGDIVKGCSVSQPATSHHLALLRHSGVIYSDRDGKNNRYSLTDKGQIAAGLLASMMEQEV